MPGDGHPVPHPLVEIVGGHPGVRERQDVQQPLVTIACQQGRHIAFECRLHHRVGGEFRLVRCAPLELVEHERRLERHRRLGPQRPVVVEHRDPVGLRHEVRAVRCGDPAHEVDDGRLGGGVVPLRQRIGFLGVHVRSATRHRRQRRQQNHDQCAHGAQYVRCHEQMGRSRRPRSVRPCRDHHRGQHRPGLRHGPRTGGARSACRDGRPRHHQGRRRGRADLRHRAPGRRQRAETGPGFTRIGARRRRRTARRLPPHRPADQQRRRHVPVAAADHLRRFRVAVRHQPSGTLRPHRPAAGATCCPSRARGW